MSVEEDRRDVYHSLSNLRFEKNYIFGDLYLSFVRKDSENKDLDENIEGSGFYLSNTNFFENWSITTAYRSMKIDVNDPNIRYNLLDNFGNALDLQRSPTGYYLHTFRLLSRTIQEVNMNDEIGIEFQISDH